MACFSIIPMEKYPKLCTMCEALCTETCKLNLEDMLVLLFCSQVNVYS